MLKAKDGEFFFSNWLRNRNTIEFLGIWERLMNPNFNCAEFDIIKSQAGLNRFRLSAKEWTEKTNAIGIISKAKAKPFVKWVGGKGQLIDQLEALLPADFDTRENVTYIEP